MVAAVLLALTLSVDAGTPSPLEGTWELDLKASSDTAPMLDFLEVGGIVKMMAPKIVTTQIIAVTSERLELTVRSPLRTRTTLWPFDGKTPVVDDLFDNRTELTSTYAAGVVTSSGTLTFKGKAVPMKVRRFIEGGRMVQQTTLEPAGRDPILSRRVFARK